MRPDSAAERRIETRVDAVVRALRERGQRLTPQRLAIVRAFFSRDDHPSAEAILDDIRRDLPMVAPSTVYHTLHALVDLGEAVEVAPTAPHARLDPSTHDHKGGRPHGGLGRVGRNGVTAARTDC